LKGSRLKEPEDQVVFALSFGIWPGKLDTSVERPNKKPKARENTRRLIGLIDDVNRNAHQHPQGRMKCFALSSHQE
jgi:hypothetical protein